MRRLVTTAIVGCWVVMIALLVQRSSPPSSSEPLAPIASENAEREEWMGVYYKSQKIGYTHHSAVPDGEGLVFSEASLLRLTVLDTPQTVRTQMRGRTGSDFALQEVDFELSSGAGRLRAHAVVEGRELRLELHTGADVTRQSLPLPEPLYVPSMLRALVNSTGLVVGRRFEVLVFDPTTMRNERMLVVVEGEEEVPQRSPQVRGWRVREEFHGVSTTAWLDNEGSVLREEGPMGLVLVRQTAEEAQKQGWNDETVFDLVAQAAVPVDHPIDNPRDRTTLRLRLSGISPDQVPNSEGQTWDGVVLTISKMEIEGLPSYPLPYQGKEHAADLAPTVFMQSDHPRVIDQARAVIGGERDARRAAGRLNDWVHGYLRKVPAVSIPNALQVLDMGEGDCNEHAVLLAALARAVGLPARVVVGAVYMDKAFLYHAWCEVWLGRWVPIDPALHQFPADATHIKFATGGPDAQLAMVSIIGQLRVEVLGESTEPGR